MSDKMEVYYFSPTGGTKKVSDIFAAAVGKDAVWHVWEISKRRRSNRRVS